MTTIFRGDEAVYTGETQILHGGLFYAARLTEGHRFGQVIWTQTAPDEMPAWVQRAQADYRGYLFDFKHLGA